MPDPVECHSGAEYAEEPLKFFWEGEWRTVRRIAARRRLPEGKEFVVEDERKERFILRFHSELGEWTIRPGS